MEILFGHINDTDSIMSFLGKYWKKGHIMSTNKELFLYEFAEGEMLNIAFSRTLSGEVTGIFGFKKYSKDDFPDIAGAIWVVNKAINSPMLGLKLRNFVIKNVPHRHFAAPGATVSTRNIYEYLNMDWVRMDQYFILNPEIDDYKIARVPSKYNKSFNLNNTFGEGNIKMYLTCESEVVKNFPFEENRKIFPYKDYAYIKKRFFSHPVYKYDVYVVESDAYGISNIIICRVVSNGKGFAYRIVDFYGNEELLKYITQQLYKIILHIYHNHILETFSHQEHSLLSHLPIAHQYHNRSPRHQKNQAHDKTNTFQSDHLPYDNTLCKPSLHQNLHCQIHPTLNSYPKQTPAHDNKHLSLYLIQPHLH